MPIKSALNYMINWVYPPVCVLCLDVMEACEQTGVCSKCAEDLSYIQKPVCEKCGRHIEEEHISCICDESALSSFDHNISLFVYENKIRKAILEFKVGKKPEIGYYFGELMADYFLREIKEDVDCIVSAPMHKKKLRKQRLDHAAILAEVIGKKTGIPFLKDVLVRTRSTKKQSDLNYEERHENLKGAFSAVNAELVKGKRIMLIDDIFTSGSTIENCSRALKKCEAAKIISYTLSSTH